VAGEKNEQRENGYGNQGNHRVKEKSSSAGRPALLPIPLLHAFRNGDLFRMP